MTDRERESEQKALARSSQEINLLDVGIGHMKKHATHLVLLHHSQLHLLMLWLAHLLSYLLADFLS